MIDPDEFAEWVSEEAQLLSRTAAHGPADGSDIESLRRHYDAFNDRMLDAALRTFAVDIAQDRIGGVPVHVAMPPEGVGSDHVLLCLHGGAFMWGAGAGALLEAIPLAATARCKVIAVDYRLAPEHPYPAAVDDVVTVYRELITSHAPFRIGIYGCSAGGVLTAQSVARMILDRTEVPGAIAMLHGTGLEFSGDLAAAAPAFSGQDTLAPPTAAELPYFSAADLGDPLIMPGNHPGVLAQFPPSMLVTATRDFAASACSVMHRRLLAAGVEARFVMFDGLGHAHHMAVDLPESRETFGILANFFAEQLD